MKLSRDYYLTEDVTKIARDLLGKFLVTQIDGHYTAGVITETEAYAGSTDRASHAYGGKLTARTEVMYRQGGVAYVYLCYGIHSLFNVVTHREGIPHAVLIRGIHVTDGIKPVIERLARQDYKVRYTNGPGKVSRALGIHYRHSGEDLLGSVIWLEDRAYPVPDILSLPRVGIAYAGEDALLPYRYLFSVKQQ